MLRSDDVLLFFPGSDVVLLGQKLCYNVFSAQMLSCLEILDHICCVSCYCKVDVMSQNITKCETVNLSFIFLTFAKSVGGSY